MKELGLKKLKIGAQQLQEKQNIRPISLKQLEGLILYLNFDNPYECDQSPKRASDYLNELFKNTTLSNRKVQETLEWLGSWGGRCDCGIVMNIADSENAGILRVFDEQSFSDEFIAEFFEQTDIDEEKTKELNLSFLKTTSVQIEGHESKTIKKPWQAFIISENPYNLKYVAFIGRPNHTALRYSLLDYRAMCLAYVSGEATKQNLFHNKQCYKLFKINPEQTSLLTSEVVHLGKLKATITKWKVNNSSIILWRIILDDNPMDYFVLASEISRSQGDRAEVLRWIMNLL